MIIPGTILVAEDDVGIADLLVEVLKDEEYTVQLVTAGHAVLAALQEHRPDLAFLDMGLPGMNGWEVLDEARSHGIDVPLVIMTAGRFPVDDLLVAGACAFLQKPFDLDELLACVARHIRSGLR